MKRVWNVSLCVYVLTFLVSLVCERKINLGAPKSLSQREKPSRELLRDNLPVTEIHAQLIASFKKANQKLKECKHSSLSPICDPEAPSNFKSFFCLCFTLSCLSGHNHCTSYICWLMSHVSLKCIKLSCVPTTLGTCYQDFQRLSKKGASSNLAK